jgi:hypothetical protein
LGKKEALPYYATLSILLPASGIPIVTHHIIRAFSRLFIWADSFLQGIIIILSPGVNAVGKGKGHYN